IDAGDQQGMTHRDKIGSPLRTHNAGSLRHRQYIALGDLPATNLLKSVGLHKHPCLGGGCPESLCFLRHIHHARPTGRVKMGKLRHAPRLGKCVIFDYESPLESKSSLKLVASPELSEALEAPPTY